MRDRDRRRRSVADSAPDDEADPGWIVLTLSIGKIAQLVNDHDPVIKTFPEEGYAITVGVEELDCRPLDETYEATPEARKLCRSTPTSPRKPSTATHHAVLLHRSRIAFTLMASAALMTPTS